MIIPMPWTPGTSSGHLLDKWCYVIKGRGKVSEGVLNMFVPAGWWDEWQIPLFFNPLLQWEPVGLTFHTHTHTHWGEAGKGGEEGKKTGIKQHRTKSCMSQAAPVCAPKPDVFAWDNGRSSNCVSSNWGLKGGILQHFYCGLIRCFKAFSHPTSLVQLNWTLVCYFSLVWFVWVGVNAVIEPGPTGQRVVWRDSLSSVTNSGMVCLSC